MSNVPAILFWVVLIVGWGTGCLDLPQRTIATPALGPDTGALFDSRSGSEDALPANDMEGPQTDLGPPQNDLSVLPTPVDVSGSDSAPPRDAGPDANHDAAPVCVPEGERCDGRDNDCDGAIDESSSPQGKCKCERGEPGGYVLCSRGVSWHAARAACAARGSHLASIHTETENEAVLELVGRVERGDGSPASRGWIGLHDHDEEGQFVWVDETEPDFFVSEGEFLRPPWVAGRPNNLMNEDCVEVLSGASLGGQATTGWNDAPCNDPHAFVCNP